MDATVETIREDDEHGSTALSVLALSVLRGRATELADATDDETGARDAGNRNATDGGEAWEELVDLAVELREARPAMVVLKNRIDRAMADASAAATPAALERAASEAIEHAKEADEDAAEHAARAVSGAVLVLSRSGTVSATLSLAALDTVLVATSRPGGEGIGVAEELAEAGEVPEVVLVPDAAIAHVLNTRAVDAVLVGADSVLGDGTVMNKIGTRSVALAADREGVPTYVVAARAKITNETEPAYGTIDREVVYDGDADLGVERALFDATPPEMVSALFTENGRLDTDEIGELAEQSANETAWQPR